MLRCLSVCWPCTPAGSKPNLGGAQVPVSVDERIEGLMTVIERHVSHRVCKFLDYQGARMPW